MKLKNKTTGQILKLESGLIFGELAENKSATPMPYNQAVSIDEATLQGLLAGNLSEWEPFEDAWGYPTKYRYFATNDEIAQVAKADRDAYNEIFDLPRVDFTNGVELYFDSVLPKSGAFIVPDKLETNPKYKANETLL